MEELVPILCTFTLGIPIGQFARGRRRLLFSSLVVIIGATLSTIGSGEFHVSWTYLLLDLGEAALGIVLAFACVRLLHSLSPQLQKSDPLHADNRSSTKG